jgi:hypothetical protein
MVSFVDPNGKSYSGDISETGEYKVPAVPFGIYKVTIDNEMLKMQDGPGMVPPGAPPGVKLPDLPAKKPGHYVAIPDKYRRAETTTASVTIAKDQESQPIELQ